MSTPHIPIPRDTPPTFVCLRLMAKLSSSSDWNATHTTSTGARRLPLHPGRSFQVTSRDTRSVVAAHSVYSRDGVRVARAQVQLPHRLALDTMRENMQN